MTFEENVLADPRHMIKAVVANNMVAVAKNAKALDTGDLTMQGYTNVLQLIWDAGREDEVWNYLNVPYLPENGPDHAADFMQAWGEPGDRLIQAYERAVGAKNTGIAAPNLTGVVPIKTISTPVLVTILIVIFIWHAY